MCLSNGCSAVNGCRQSESLIKHHSTPVHQLLEEALLWILDVLMMDLFQLLSSRDVN